jgi:hypothetical protein
MRRYFLCGPAYKDVSPEAEERPPLEAVTEQRDWGQSRIAPEVRQWTVEWSQQFSEGRRPLNTEAEEALPEVLSEDTVD